MRMPARALGGARVTRIVAPALGLLVVALSVTVHASALTVTTDSAQPSQFVLDGVRITVSGAAVPAGSTFAVTSAGNAEPSASATTHDPYRELTISAVPFAASDGADPVIGVAGPGKAAPARTALRAFRVSQRARSLGSRPAALFGAEVSGDASLVSLRLDSARSVPTVVVEWVTQSGPRLWLIRAAAELDTAAPDAVAARLADVTVTAADASSPTTVGPAPGGMGSGPTHIGSAVEGSANDQTGGLTFPTWWNGNCDTATYSAAAQQQWGRPIAAYPLSSGASWFGLEACGPRPFYGEGPDVGVRFPGSSWGILEWECVELSMRYMFLAWGVHPYPANGKDVVWNYARTQAQFNPGGPQVEAISNNGDGPLPQPGDVLSYGATSSFGHTSVVTAVNVDTSGNGTVTVLEENASASGWDTVPVSSWVLGGYGGVSGWLHNPGFLPVPSNARAAMRASDGTTRAFYGLDSASPVFGGSWAFEGGGAVGAPDVVSVPSSSDRGSPLYLVTGMDHNLWIRSDAAAWRPLSPFAVYCTGPPGATVVAQTPGTAGPYVLVAACRGADGTLWYTETPVSTNPASLPSARDWWGLGGAITDAPAVVPVGHASSLLGEVEFLVNGTDGRVWTRTAGGPQWRATPLGCIGDLAGAAVVTTQLVSAFACQGADHGVWVTTTTGSGWSQALSLGNWVLGSPGIVLSPTSVTLVAEGGDGALWQTSAATGTLGFGPWTSSGDSLDGSVTATALLPSSANP